MGLLRWYEQGPLGIFIRESLWGYPIVLSSHAIGMAIVVGTVVALNMRTLGYAKGISVMAYDKVFVMGWFGFYLNLVSGLILFANKPVDYTFQGSFQLKIGLILLGGILMKMVMNAIRSGKSEMTVRIYSFACLASWMGAIVTGRLMAYLA